jgi:uncharacterized protein YbaR (Trm112 family)
MQCPVCKQDMKKVSENHHYHCNNAGCGICYCNGVRYQFFSRAEETYCPKDSEWKKEFFFKTGNLA